MSLPVASLYARLSKKADEHNLSLDGMVKEMIERCHKEGWEPRYIHTDDGISGGKRDRDEFTAWLADATEGRAQILMNPSTDRLTREGLNVAANILDVVEGKDPTTGRVTSRPVRLVDLQGIDSEHGDAFRFRFVVQAEVGRSERERIRTRARSTAKRLREAGRVRGGGGTPYGYRIAKAADGKGYTYEVVREEAEVVKEIARRILDDQSPSRVARWLNHAGHKPRRAAEWRAIVVRNMITGHAILGRMSSNGVPLRNDDGEIVQHFPAIISLAEHNAIVDILGERKFTFNSRPVRKGHLLSGMLLCYACNRPMYVGGSGSRVSYRCASRGNGQVCERSTSAVKSAVETAITGLYLSKYGNEPMYRTRTVVEGVDDLAVIQEDIKECLADIAQAATPEAVERLQKLQRRRAEAESRPPVKRTLKEPTGQTVAQWWEDPRTHLDDKRDALRNAYGRLTLHPGKRGAHGFDVTRLTFEHSTEED